MPRITTIEALPTLEHKKRVAGYSRVSSGKDAMLHSLSSQISYYSTMIQAHDDWVYAGVYADEAKTGTKETRPEFQKLLVDCRAGKIDMVITKSISRFARNTVTLLEAVRELKALGVDIFFEEQNLHTLSSDGELMLTILASYAQEESKSVSDNMKWRIKKNFEEGKPWDGTVLGYRYKGGQYIIQTDEAETVQRIYELYLSGNGVSAIGKILKAEGRRTRLNNDTWSDSSIGKILRNDTYTGNLTLQKTFREDHISKRTQKNKGELPMFKAEETHEAIIPQETFDAVQAEISRRAALRKQPQGKPTPTAFSGKMKCALCGKSYRRKTGSRGPIWQCSTYNKFGKTACPSKQIPEDTLLTVTADLLGLPEFSAVAFAENVSEVLVCTENRILFQMTDGTEREVFWVDRSRSQSWTPEMKAKARQKALERKETKHAKSNENTGNH